MSHDDACLDHTNIINLEVARSASISITRPPSYWFVQTVSEIIMDTDALKTMLIDESRPSCSLNTAGESKFSKKPAYFDAQNTTPYDQALQHRREEAGRPTDASGREHRQIRPLPQPRGHWREIRRRLIRPLRANHVSNYALGGLS